MRGRPRIPQELAGKRVAMEDWTGRYDGVEVLAITTYWAEVRLPDGTEVRISRAKFDGAMRRAASD